MSSLSNTPDPLVSALHACTRREDVRALKEAYGETRLRQAWVQLDQLTKNTLVLCKAFDGIVVGKSELVLGEQAALSGAQDPKRLAPAISAAAGRNQD